MNDPEDGEADLERPAWCDPQNQGVWRVREVHHAKRNHAQRKLCCADEKAFAPAPKKIARIRGCRGPSDAFCQAREQSKRLDWEREYERKVQADVELF